MAIMGKLFIYQFSYLIISLVNQVSYLQDVFEISKEKSEVYLLSSWWHHNCIKWWGTDQNSKVRFKVIAFCESNLYFFRLLLSTVSPYMSALFSQVDHKDMVTIHVPFAIEVVRDLLICLSTDWWWLWWNWIWRV